MTRRKTLIAAVSISVAALMTVSSSAMDFISLAGGERRPSIDGAFEGEDLRLYQKIHDFYQPDAGEWPDDNDPNHKAKGEAWATWDSDFLFCLFKVYEPQYKPGNVAGDSPRAQDSSCIYLSFLGTEPDDYTKEQIQTDYVLQFAFNRSQDNTLEWKYTGSVKSEYRDSSEFHDIYPDLPPIQFECRNDGSCTYYECAIPWSELDRTGEQVFRSGHKILFNYCITWWDADEGEYRYLQYGRGLMWDKYDMGGTVTLETEPSFLIGADNRSKPSPGEYVDIMIGLRGNPGVNTLRAYLEYDPSVFKIVEVRDEGILGEYFHSDDYTLSSYVLEWINGSAEADYTVNGGLAGLTLRVREGIADCETQIKICYHEPTDIINHNMQPVKVNPSTYNFTIKNVACGDADGDGEGCTALDAMILARYLAQWNGYSDMIFESACDLDCDGKVTPRDAVILARHIAGWPGFETLPYTM